MGMHTYVVRQGDYLTRLAAQRGFDADEVWNHADNAALRRRRPSPEVLAPGDLIRLPEREPRELRLRSRTKNRFRASVPRVEIRVTLTQGDQRLSNEPYVVEGVGAASITGSSDGSGVVSVQVPVTTSALQLRLPNRSCVYPILVGHMDPLSEDSGLRSRLQHLGHLDGSLRESLSFGALGTSAFLRETIPGPADDALPAALESFQRAHGLPVTGRADEATVAAIRRAHDEAQP